MARKLGLVAGVAAMLGLSACGGPSAAQRVRTTVQGYAKAFARHDYQALCDRYLAPSIGAGLLASTGVPCESAIRAKVSTTVDPTLKVGAIHVTGDKATAAVHTTAVGEAPSDDTMALQRIRGQWRITALAQPEPLPVGP